MIARKYLEAGILISSLLFLLFKGRRISLEDKYLTISQINKYVKRKFDMDPYLEHVYLRGEISNSKRNRRNTHMYFSLKDDNAKISAVMFYSSVKKLKFEPEEGMNVLVVGRLSVYERSGQYQIIIDEMQPDGIGALYQALEQTKKKLAKEGLFDSERKQPLVKYPERIAVVTSQSGAVIRDIITTIKRRYPIVELVLYPTFVQGEKSVDSVARNIQQADRAHSFDTIIIGRGGGSIEDLWSFNDEKVVRTISEATTPIISSVGHETDTTLSDFVADVRAATPTAAAELAVPVLVDEKLKLQQYEQQMVKQVQTKINHLSERLEHSMGSYIFRQPRRLYEGYVLNVDQKMEELVQTTDKLVNQRKQEVNLLSQRLMAQNPKQAVQYLQGTQKKLQIDLSRSLKQLLKDKNKQINNLMQSLDHLSPLKILDRGYSYTTKNDEIVKEVEEINIGDELSVHLSDGWVDAEVKEINKKVEE